MSRVRKLARFGPTMAGLEENVIFKLTSMTDVCSVRFRGILCVVCVYSSVCILVCVF